MDIKTVLDIVGTGLTGMLFYIILQFMAEVKAWRSDNMTLIVLLINKLPMGEDDKDVLQSQIAPAK